MVWCFLYAETGNFPLTRVFIKGPYNNYDGNLDLYWPPAPFDPEIKWRRYYLLISMTSLLQRVTALCQCMAQISSHTKAKDSKTQWQIQYFYSFPVWLSSLNPIEEPSLMYSPLTLVTQHIGKNSKCKQLWNVSALEADCKPDNESHWKMAWQTDLNIATK